MSTYTFEADDGSRIERDFAAIDVPDHLSVDGKDYRALFGASPGVGAPKAIVRDERHVAYSLPRLWQQPNIGKIWDKFDERGHVLCEGKRDRVELGARMRATEEFKDYGWDR